MKMQDFLHSGKDYFLPNLSIDHVIIGYEEGTLKCLLIRIGDQWALPGGFVMKEESVEQAHVRILKERTNLPDPHSRFLAVFGDPDRRFQDKWRRLIIKLGLEWRDDYWINDRFVTLAYYALVDIHQATPEPGEHFDEVRWWSFDDLPEMWLDHKSIAMEARKRLKEDIKKNPVAHNLLPEEFTMPALHQLHQAILEESLDRSRFQKNMLASRRFKRLPELQNDAPGRNPYLYRLKPSKD